jgi:uracil phosphoribosyltransferase
MRQADTSTAKFRQLMKEVGMLLAYEVTRDLPLKYEEIKTPLALDEGSHACLRKEMVVVSIMRAGQGLLDGILELIPFSPCRAYLGCTANLPPYTTIEYYFKLPHDVEHRDVLVVDPMLATGNSAGCCGRSP